MEVALLCKNKIFADSLSTALKQIEGIEIEHFDNFDNSRIMQSSLILLDIDDNEKESLFFIEKNSKKKIIAISKYRNKVYNSKFLNAGATSVINISAGKEDYKKLITKLLKTK